MRACDELYAGFECAIYEALSSSDILGPLVAVLMVLGILAPPAIAKAAIAYNLLVRRRR